MPEIAKSWNDLGVEFKMSTPATGEGKIRDLLIKLINYQVGLLEADFKQRIIEAAVVTQMNLMMIL